MNSQSYNIKTNLEKEEIKDFYDSLTEEKKTFQTPIEEIFKSEIIFKKNENNDKIIGIAGIRRHRIISVIPFLFIVVKLEFQRKGIGRILLEQLLEIAKKKHSFIILSVFENNKCAMHLYKKHGFTIFGTIDDRYYMIRSFNMKGNIVSKLLTFVITFYEFRYFVSKFIMLKLKIKDEHCENL